jgi:hypothetical protein
MLCSLVAMETCLFVDRYLAMAVVHLFVLQSLPSKGSTRYNTLVKLSVTLWTYFNQRETEWQWNHTIGSHKELCYLLFNLVSEKEAYINNISLQAQCTQLYASREWNKDLVLKTALCFFLNQCWWLRVPIRTVKIITTAAQTNHHAVHKAETMALLCAYKHCFKIWCLLRSRWLFCKIW